MAYERPLDPTLYSEKLLGLRNDCDMPGCRGWGESTGRLLYDPRVAKWFIEFHCPDHGVYAAWRPEWQPLVEELTRPGVESER